MPQQKRGATVKRRWLLQPGQDTRILIAFLNDAAHSGATEVYETKEGSLGFRPAGAEGDPPPNATIPATKSLPETPAREGAEA